MQARLTLISGAAAPVLLTLDTDQIISLGRTRHNTIVIADQTVSRRHAEIYAEAGAWFLREVQPTTNGTRINGKCIQGTQPLHHNDQIMIGSAHLCFTLDASKETEPAAVTKTDEQNEAEASPTLLQADELTVLLHFMNDSLQENTPRCSFSWGAATVYNQTQAAVAGFFSLDPQEPLTRVVVPSTGQVEPQLSRQLTQQVLRSQRSVWLATKMDLGADTNSLAGFRDAICVPLAADPKTHAAPLGALHVYKTTRPFTEREAQFCELLANALANNLRLLRERRVLEANIVRLRRQGGGLWRRTDRQ